MEKKVRSARRAVLSSCFSALVSEGLAAWIWRVMEVSASSNGATNCSDSCSSASCVHGWSQHRNTQARPGTDCLLWCVDLSASPMLLSISCLQDDGALRRSCISFCSMARGWQRGAPAGRSCTARGSA